MFQGGEPSNSDINHRNLPATPVRLPSIEIMFFFFYWATGFSSGILSQKGPIRLRHGNGLFSSQER
jgi:hypothetical protein